MNLADILKLLTFLTNVQPIVAQTIISLTASLQGKSLEEIQAESDTLFDAIAQRARAELELTPVEKLPDAPDRDSDGTPDFRDADPDNPKVS